MSFTPTVLKAEENREFRWVGDIAGMSFLFAGEHYFILTPNDNGGTRLEHGEKFSGILVPLLWAKLQKNTPRGFENFNREIKRQSENGL